MQQVRLTKTPEIEKVLAYLKSKYSLLSEAEIIKMVLSEKYQEEKDQRVKKEFEDLSVEGRKIGDKFLKNKGLKREDITEEEFYNLLKND